MSNIFSTDIMIITIMVDPSCSRCIRTHSLRCTSRIVPPPYLLEFVPCRVQNWNMTSKYSLKLTKRCTLLSPWCHGHRSWWNRWENSCSGWNRYVLINWILYGSGVHCHRSNITHTIFGCELFVIAYIWISKSLYLSALCVKLWNSNVCQIRC